MYSTAVCPFCLHAERLLKFERRHQIEKIRVDLDPRPTRGNDEQDRPAYCAEIYIGDTHVADSRNSRHWNTRENSTPCSRTSPGAPIDSIGADERNAQPTLRHREKSTGRICPSKSRAAADVHADRATAARGFRSRSSRARERSSCRGDLDHTVAQNSATKTLFWWKLCRQAYSRSGNVPDTDPARCSDSLPNVLFPPTREKPFPISSAVRASPGAARTREFRGALSVARRQTPSASGRDRNAH